MNYMIKDGFRVLTFLPLYFNVAKNQVIQNRKVVRKPNVENNFRGMFHLVTIWISNAL